MGMAPREPAQGGVLSSRQIQAMAEAGAIRVAAPLAQGQIQPASLDLRLGRTAYRVRASFLSSAAASMSFRSWKD